MPRFMAAFSPHASVLGDERGERLERCGGEGDTESGVGRSGTDIVDSGGEEIRWRVEEESGFGGEISAPAARCEADISLKPGDGVRWL